MLNHKIINLPVLTTDIIRLIPDIISNIPDLTTDVNLFMDLFRYRIREWSGQGEPQLTSQAFFLNPGPVIYSTEPLSYDTHDKIAQAVEHFIDSKLPSFRPFWDHAVRPNLYGFTIGNKGVPRNSVVSIDKDFWIILIGGWNRREHSIPSGRLPDNVTRNLIQTIRKHYQKPGLMERAFNSFFR